MALFIRQSEERSRLQERLNSELQDRQKQTQLENKPETVDDSAFLKDTKNAGSLAWLWFVALLVAGFVIGYFIYLGVA